MVELLNLMPIDAFVPGNHEFDFGKEVFLKRISEAKFPLFAANLRDVQGKAIDRFMDNRVFEFGGVKIGLAGLANEDTNITSRSGDLRFDFVRDTAEQQSALLRKAGAEIIVLVSHSDRATDNAILSSGVADVILSGHDHDIYLNYNGRSAIIELGEDGLIIAAVNLTVDVSENDGKRRVSWWPRFRFIDTADVDTGQGGSCPGRGL